MIIVCRNVPEDFYLLNANIFPTGDEPVSCITDYFDITCDCGDSYCNDEFY